MEQNRDHGDLILPYELRRAMELRKMHRNPDTLFDLTISCIEINFDYFCRSKHSLQNLPPSCAQKVLDVISAKSVKGDVPADRVQRSLETAMSKQATAADLIPCCWRDMCQEMRRSMPQLFQHVLRNCPRLTRMRFWSNVYGRKDPPSLVPVLQFKRAWPNLRVLSCNLYCSDDTMRLFKDNFPNLEVLEVNLNLGDGDDQFTLKGLQLMRCLRKLRNFAVLEHRFFFLVGERRRLLRPDPWMYALIAGNVETLEVLGVCYFALNTGNWFIEHMAVRYPEREIAVKKISIQNGLRKKWPRNLRVLEFITVTGALDDGTIENLGGLSAPVKLELYSVPDEDIFRLLLVVGDKVQALQLDNADRAEDGLDVYRVLLLCPNLESFKVGLRVNVWRNAVQHHLTPAHFKNYSSFVTFDDSPALLTLTWMFIMGSERIEELRVRGRKELEILQRALASDRTWLPKLTVLTIRAGEEDGDDVVDLLVSVVNQVVCKCTLVKKVVVHVNSDNLSDAGLDELNGLWDLIDCVDPTVLEIIQHNAGDFVE